MITIDLLGDKNTNNLCPYCSAQHFDNSADHLVEVSRVLSDVNFEIDNESVSFEGVINTCINGHQSVFFNQNEYQYKIKE